MDPKFLAKAKARTAGVKGPPPLPAVDQERPTPRPPALDPDLPTPIPPAPDEPPPTPRGLALKDSAGEMPLTPRPVPVEAQGADDEDEHTVMRPATAPLPRDAFRENGAASQQASEAEPSVGLPLELSVPQPSSRKSRAGIAYVLLGALALGAGASALMQQREASSTAASGAAGPAPKSFTRPPPPPAPVRPRDEAALEPPISTSAEDNEALPEEETVAAPQVRRRPRRPAPSAAPPTVPPSTAVPPTAAPGELSAAAGAPGIATTPDSEAPAHGEPAAGAAAAAPTPQATTPATEARPAAPNAGSKPAAGESEAQAGEDELQGNVDHDNPYGE